MRRSSRFVVDCASLIRVERGREDGRQVSRPTGRLGTFLQDLARPALGVGVRGGEVFERVRLPDSPAKLGEQNAEKLEQLPVTMRIVASSLEATASLLPLVTRERDLAHCEQQRSGQRGSTWSRMRSPSS